MEIEVILNGEVILVTLIVAWSITLVWACWVAAVLRRDTKAMELDIRIIRTKIELRT